MHSSRRRKSERENNAGKYHTALPKPLQRVPAAPLEGHLGSPSLSTQGAAAVEWLCWPSSE